MKTSKNRTFPKLENEFVENMLRQLVNQHHIIQMFFTRDTHAVFSHLIVHVEKNSDAQELQQSKWVKKVRKRFQIALHFIYSNKLLHSYSLGHPFMEYYCQASALIYQNEDLGSSSISTSDWKKYKKKFHVFQEAFQHDHDLHKSHIQKLISEGASNSVFTAYARLIAYNLDFLEELYIGNKSNALNLEERIKTITEYIPEIQKNFVKNSPSKYYLTDLFIKANEAGEVCYKDELYQAVAISEASLFHLVEKRFYELKKLIKKEALHVRKGPNQRVEKPKDAILETAIETILNALEVEQIYLFHQVTYGPKTTYYLMLLGAGGSNEKLSSIRQSLLDKTEGKYDFVMLSHSRYWIQNNLYQNQSFFTAILQEQQLVYASSPYHPELHWEVPHIPYHGDLYFFYKATKESADQFFAVVNNPKANLQGLATIFSLFFLSFCRTYIFVKKYYLPNYLSSHALWHLCVYAGPDIRKYHYLIEQFWTDFFPYLDKHRTISHNLSNLDTEKVTQMNLIVEQLMDELHHLVVEGGLLVNFEEDETA